MTARAVRKTATDAWLLLQGTLAVTAAWYVARDVFGHPDPFFAPIAAMVSLNTDPGERGLNALRLLTGALIGIGTGEVILGWLGLGYGRLALATFVAMALARAFGGARIVIAQAAGGAILTVATSQGDEIGPQRLVDAIIGVGTALTFSQFLFSPEPVALVRRAERGALLGMAEGLHLAARAFEAGDDELADEALGRLRALRDALSELARTRKASVRVTRHAPARRRRRTALEATNERAGHLDLLGASCLLLTRTAGALDVEARGRVAPAVRSAAEVLADLAEAPGDADVRRAAVARLEAASWRLPVTREGEDPRVTRVRVAVAMLTEDLARFAGGDETVAGERGREPP